MGANVVATVRQLPDRRVFGEASRRSEAATPERTVLRLSADVQLLTSFGTVALTRLVNAPTALFAAESLRRRSPISTPRFLP
jgi:hypothetical protein